ncbi:TRAFAC clade GTPase domain-containing protein [Scytonema sp. NUACC26]|uniref:TRAFAC clade GTPase domain-containing protein n=1 Tax=Scytonema sp. NUACC26 TaxID=3140176 RepID=UPI0034DBEB03
MTISKTKGEIITIVGPKNSGKTTYLAGLADWPETRAKQKKRSPFLVEPIGDATKKLRDEARGKILDGVYLEPTQVQQNFNDLPRYIFKIKIKRLFTEEAVTLVVRDYPGEIYNKLAEAPKLQALEQEYIQECLRPDVVGCLVLLDKWERENDLTYMKAMEKFLDEMDKQGRLQGAKPLRIAVAMSKCERGEIWTGRLDPETDIFKSHLPGTTQLLQNKLKNHVKFFAISTFGVLALNDPRPNRKSERKIDFEGKEVELSVLRDKDEWRPYGMISPLYWLSKGRSMRYGL